MTQTISSAGMGKPPPRNKAGDGKRVAQASLSFIARQHAKPDFKSTALTGGLPEMHFRTEAHEVTIHGMRQRADGLSLEREGVVLRRHGSPVADRYDDEAIRAVYVPELQGLLRDLTRARQVVVFDHTRRSDAPQGAARQRACRWTTP